MSGGGGVSDSDDGLFPLDGFTPESSPQSPQAGEGSVGSVVETAEAHHEAPPTGEHLDVPMQAAPVTMDSPTKAPPPMKAPPAKDPPPPPNDKSGGATLPAPTSAVDPWQNLANDPWAPPLARVEAPPAHLSHYADETPTSVKAPPAHLMHYGIPETPPAAQSLSQSRPPPPPKLGPQHVPKPPPKNAVPPPPKPPPKKAPPAKANSYDERDTAGVFASVQENVQQQYSMQQGIRPPVPPTPYPANAPSLPKPAPLGQPFAGASQQSGINWYKLCAWVPDEKNKFIFCFRLGEGVIDVLSQNATNLYSSVLGEETVEEVQTSDNCQDATMLSNLTDVCRWENIFMMRLDIPAGPFEGMAAVGVGSNVKFRQRAAKLALAVTVRVALRGLSPSSSSHVPEFEQLVNVAVRRRNYDISHFEKGANNQAPLESSESFEANSSVHPTVNEPANSSGGTRLLQHAVQEATRPAAPSYQPAVSRPQLATWDVPAPAPAPKMSAPARAMDTTVEELLRQGIPRECLDSPWIELRPWEGYSPWPFCTLCNKWADGSHMISKNHLRKVDWMGGEEPQSVAPNSVARGRVVQDSWNTERDPWGPPQTTLDRDAQEIDPWGAFATGGPPTVGRSSRPEPPVYAPTPVPQHPLIPESWEEHNNDAPQDYQGTVPIHIGDDSDDAENGDDDAANAIVGLPASFHGRNLDLRIPTWKELHEQNMPHYYALGFDLNKTTVVS